MITQPLRACERMSWPISLSVIGGAVAVAVFLGVLAFLFLGRWIGCRAIARAFRPANIDWTRTNVLPNTKEGEIR